ncbi:hypothetical protein CW713_12020 [Methanophagales archaeon]|nr:MAG: hypothetical protein CW713_12020 [Methanophagales archaeon]
MSRKKTASDGLRDAVKDMGVVGAAAITGGAAGGPVGATVLGGLAAAYSLGKRVLEGSDEEDEE